MMILLGLMLIGYGYACWQENRTVDKSERALHFGFRFVPLLVLGLLAVGAHAEEPEPERVNLAAVETPIIITRSIKRLHIERKDLMDRTIERIRCQRTLTGGRTIPTIERWGQRTIIIRCP